MSKVTRLGLRWSALTVGVLALAALSNPSVRSNQRAGLLPPEVMKLMTVYGAEAVALDRAPPGS